MCRIKILNCRQQERGKSQNYFFGKPTNHYIDFHQQLAESEKDTNTF